MTAIESTNRPGGRTPPGTGRAEIEILDSTYCSYLELMRRLPLGVLRLSHLVTNPTRTPDYLYRHDCRFRTFPQGEFETTLWMVTRAGSQEIAAWRGHGRHAPVDNRLVLSDLEGNILMQDYRSGDEAAGLMTQVLATIRPFRDALLTAVNWIGSDHEAIRDACRTGLIYELAGVLEEAP